MFVPSGHVFLFLDECTYDFECMDHSFKCIKYELLIGFLVDYVIRN